MLIKPKALLYLYDFDHFEEVDDYLCRLGFIPQSNADHIKFYKGENEVLMIDLSDGNIVQATYKTLDELNYLAFINYAEDDLGYILIHEDQKTTSSFRRYDGDRHSLIFVVISGDLSTSYTVRLQDKLDQTSGVLYDISIDPPPKPVNRTY